LPAGIRQTRSGGKLQFYCCNLSRLYKNGACCQLCWFSKSFDGNLVPLQLSAMMFRKKRLPCKEMKATGDGALLTFQYLLLFCKQKVLVYRNTYYKIIRDPTGKKGLLRSAWLS